MHAHSGWTDQSDMNFRSLRCCVLLCLVAYTARVQQVAAAAAAAAATSESAGVTNLHDSNGSSNSGISSVANLPGMPFPAADAMLEWIKQHGGQVNVAVRELPGVGRYTVAARDIKAGDILAAIPVKLCFVQDENENDVAAGVRLLAEMRDPSSKFKPYLEALPAKGQTRSYYTFPDGYLPLIGNAFMLDLLIEFKDDLLDSWRLSRQEPAAAALGHNVTFRDLQYAVDLLHSRMFAMGELGYMLIPLLDMANHYNNCPHSIPDDMPCQPGSEDLCVFWRAEADVPAGDEVCNGYHNYMLQDRALLQYGFLQMAMTAGQTVMQQLWSSITLMTARMTVITRLPSHGVAGGDVAEELSGIDMREFHAGEDWHAQADHKPLPFTGSPDELAGEVTRLHKLHKRMSYMDRILRPIIQADPDLDADGSFLKQLWEWRRQRKAAISGEMQRVSSLLDEQVQAPAVAAAGTAAAPPPQMKHPEHRFHAEGIMFDDYDNDVAEESQDDQHPVDQPDDQLDVGFDFHGDDPTSEWQLEAAGIGSW